ncbi:hypothetical protein BFW01_g5961 [Lasiodiplodia theobromae]|nr:hypothetical protein BFW01_g5961 [Lasiodiplodia theobromae]
MPAWMTPARIGSLPPPPAMEQSAPSTHKMVTRQRAARGAGASRARDSPTPGPTAEDEEDDDGLSIGYWKAQIDKVPDGGGVGDDTQAGWDQGRTGFNQPDQPEHINAAFEECFLLDPTLAVEESQKDDEDLVFVGDQDFAFLEDEDLAFLEDEDF